MNSLTQIDTIDVKVEEDKCSNENNKVKELIISLSTNSNHNQSDKDGRIPLTIPLVRDPRLMRLNELRMELRKRNLNDSGSKQVLCARVLQAIVNEGLSSIPDPLCMDDKQPEKWLLIANQQSQLAEEIQPQSLLRVKAMTEVNEVLGLESIRTCRERLMAIALGRCRIKDFNHALDTELHDIIARFAAALMIVPVVETELIEASVHNFRGASAAHRAIVGSRTIFNMRTGYMGIPEYLTEAAALSAENRSRRRKFCESDQDPNKKRKSNNINLGSTTVVLGEKALFSIGAGRRSVLVEVIRVEFDMSDEEDLTCGGAKDPPCTNLSEPVEMREVIVVRPVSVQFGGPNVEFKLSLNEFEVAKNLYDESLIEQIEAL